MNVGYDGELYAKQHKMIFYKTSAKKGRNVEKAFSETASKCLEFYRIPFFQPEIITDVHLSNESHQINKEYKCC